MNRYLPMRDISEQSLCHGSVNAAYTQLQSSGVQDATLSAFNTMLERWEAVLVDETFLTHVEALHAAALAEGIRSRLAAVPELTDLPMDAEGLRRRLEILNGLRARSVSKLSRTTESIALGVAKEAADRLRKALENAFAATPHRIPEIADQSKAALRSICTGRIRRPSPTWPSRGSSGGLWR